MKEKRELTAKLVGPGDGRMTYPLGAGVMVGLPLVCDIRDAAVPSVVTNIRVEYDHGRVAATEVSVRALEGQTVSMTLLRRIPVQMYIAEMLSKYATKIHRNSLITSLGRSVSDQAVSDAKSQGPSSKELLELVALVYRRAEVFGDKPMQAVSQTFGVPARTATRWAARAKETIKDWDGTETLRQWGGPKPMTSEDKGNEIFSQIYNMETKS